MHSECIEIIVALSPTNLEPIHRSQFGWGRALDRGNPNPGNIGSDFNRFALDFWREVKSHDFRNDDGQAMLEELNQWRNAISHQDFDPSRLGGTTTLHLNRVRSWRRALNRLARSFDNVMQSYLGNLIGKPPW